MNDFEKASVNRGFNPPGVNDIDFNPDDFTEQDNNPLDDEPEDDPFYKERGIFR